MLTLPFASLSMRPDFWSDHTGLVISAGAAVSAAGALAWGIFNVGSSLFVPVQRRIMIANAVALTFDDGPHAEFTPRVLDALARHQARASFFLIGRHVAAHPALVRRILAEGHTIGNHTWDHHHDGTLGCRTYWQQQLVLCQQAIAEATGRQPRFFRPPLGFKTPAQAAALKKAGYEVISWRLRAFDTLPLGSERIRQRISTRMRPGDIVTLHDGLEPQRLGASQISTCRAVDGILQDLRERNLRCVSLAEGLGTSPYQA